MRKLAILVLASSLLALALAGCGSHSHPGDSAGDHAAATRLAGPDAAVPAGLVDGAAAGFVPLEPGDWWRYRARLVGWLVDDADRTPLFDEADAFQDRITCDEVLGGLHYFASRRTYDGSDVLPYWTFYRQDHRGLYVLDADGSVPPPCEPAGAVRARSAAAGVRPLPSWDALASRPPRAAAHAAAWRRAYASLAARHEALARMTGALASRRGPAPGEIQQLAYPLVPGRHWIIRADPRFEATVERAVQRRIAARVLHGWSIRIRSEFFGAGDVVHVFWGRAGYLGLQAVFITTATDESGNPIGTLEAHETQSLVDLHLARGGNGSIAASPGTPGQLDD